MLIYIDIGISGLRGHLVGSWLVCQSVAQRSIWAGERDVKTQGKVEAEVTGPLSGQESSSNV